MPPKRKPNPKPSPKPAQDAAPSREMRPATVEIDPPRCISCSATEFVAIKRIGRQLHHGTRNGEPYTSIIRRRVRCKSCGQIQVHKSYRFDEAKWEKGG